MSINYAATILADSPRGYYRLGELSGTTAYDLSGNTYNGTLHGGVTEGQSGAISGDTNSSMLFDGASGYIELASGLDVAGWTAASFEWWQNVSSIADVPVPLSNGQPFVTPVGFLFYLQNTVHFAYYNGVSVIDVSSITTIALNTWQHIVVSVDSTDIRFYINGVLTNTTAQFFTSFIASTHPIAIGRSQDANSDYVPGNLDEIAIYNYKISGAQVANHYTIGSTAALSLSDSAASSDSFIDITSISDSHIASTQESLLLQPGASFSDIATATSSFAILQQYANPASKIHFTWRTRS